MIGRNFAARANGSAVLLSRLCEAHERLEQALAEMDQVTRQPVERVSFHTARWRLSAANRARRAVWDECYRHLLALGDPRTTAVLTDLNKRDIASARHSASHIARWPSSAAEQDWLRYCDASRQIRARMSAAIAAEKRLLYPLLRVERLRRAG